ncbi:hypothetical protein UG56_021020 [Nocardioides luteus]|uniref:Uncharacterized protein n=1 Tax=Nocardioides luteus TaxID=1844 RepID=A0A1J4MZU4_9ACTN|nr:hypothetical protein UG56_021020 [Nocardioides luteus]
MVALDFFDSHSVSVRKICTSYLHASCSLKESLHREPGWREYWNWQALELVPLLPTLLRVSGLGVLHTDWTQPGDVVSDTYDDRAMTCLHSAVVGGIKEVTPSALAFGVVGLSSGCFTQFVVSKISVSDAVLEVSKLWRSDESVDVLDDKYLRLYLHNHPDELLP